MIDTIKKNVGKSITIASVITVLGFLGGMKELADYRYALAGEFNQMQQQIIYDKETALEDEIDEISLKEQDGVATKYEIVRKERLKARLEALRKK